MDIKASNYITIQGWMITELGLKNSELMIYALIYSFSQDGRSAFTGSISYLMEWTQAKSKQTVHTCLNSLLERGLITKIDVTVGGTKAVGYRAKPHEERQEEIPEPAAPTDESPKIGLNSPKIGLDSPKIGLGTVQNLDSDNYSNINNINNKHTTARARAREGVTFEIPRETIETISERVKDLTEYWTTVHGIAQASAQDKKLTAEFAELWKLYPRRQGEREALAAYIAARKEGTSFEEVATGIVEYNRYIDLSDMSMRYVMQGGNWFANQRWRDEPVKLDERKPSDRPQRALNYKQRKYTAEELAALGVDLGEGIYEETGP